MNAIKKTFRWARGSGRSGGQPAGRQSPRLNSCALRAKGLEPLAGVSSWFRIVTLISLSTVVSLAQTNPLSNPNLLTQTNAVSDSEVLLSNMLVQVGVLVPTNDVVGTNESIQPENPGSTNDLNASRAEPESGSPGFRESRRDWLDRQRSAMAGKSRAPREMTETPNRASAAANASGYTPPVRPDYSNFQLIAQRNIFDPNRIPHRVRSEGPPPKTTDSFGLVGVMSYDKGTFAFFDGTSSSYRKALKLDDTIAGYKVANIDPNSVKLEAGTNQVELRVGMQMRHEENGHWTLTSQTQTYAAGAPSAPSTPSASTVSSTSGSSASDSEILERLRKRKEQE